MLISSVMRVVCCVVVSVGGVRRKSDGGKKSVFVWMVALPRENTFFSINRIKYQIWPQLIIRFHRIFPLFKWGKYSITVMNGNLR